MLNRILLLVCCFALMTAADPAFSIRVRTDIPGDSAANQFTLPLHLGSAYDCIVEWGDGTSLIVTSDTSPTHTYSVPGTYTLRIMERNSGGFPRIDCFGLDEAQKIIALVNWGDVHWSSLAGAFAGCSNMVITASDHATARTGTVTDFAMAWQGCTSLTSFPRIDTQAATSLFSTWSDCTALTSFPEIDTARVTDFSSSWFRCIKLRSFPLLDTHSGATFQLTWAYCASLGSFPAINTHAATALDAAWFGCIGLRTFPAIDTSACISFSSTWGCCSGLRSFPTVDTSAGKYFTMTWTECTNLRSFPLLDTSAGILFEATWRGCTGLTTFPAIDTSHGIAFDLAWGDCTGLLDFPRVNMRSMQYGMGCFQNVRLPGDMYSALLIDLATHNANTVVVFSGGGSCYDASAADARNTTLIAGRSWMIDDGGPETPPVITSASTASGGKGAPFTFTVTTAPRARTFTATGLPAGLTLNTATGQLTGTPATSGTFLIHLGASNTAGSDTADLLLTLRTEGTNDHDGLFGVAPSCGAGMTASLMLAFGLALRRRRN